MKFSLVVAMLFVSMQHFFAQDWTGAINSDWNNPANWSTAPQNGDDITISTNNYTGAMAHPVISSNSTFSPAELAMDGGALLTVQANLTTTDRVEIIGVGTTVIVNSGTLNVSGGAGNARFIFSEGSHFEMNGGNLVVGQRLLFELGSSGVLNSGDIDITETFALIDGDAAASSSFIQNGGFITTDEFGFENEAGNYFPSYTMNNGTFTVAGAFLVEGVAPGAGRGIFSASDGVFIVFGSLGNLAGSTTGFTLRITEDAVVNLHVSTIDQLTSDSIIVENGGTLNVLTNTTWQNAGVVTGENAQVNINANVLLNGTGVYQFPTISVAATKSLSQTGALISVNGDFNLMGTYNQGANTLEWNGEHLQHFNTTSAITLANMSMNNSSGGVELNHDLILSSSITWQNGLLSASAGELKLQNNAISASPSEWSYAIIPVSKTGNQSFVFPVGGINGRYRPLEIMAPTSASTEIRVDYNSNAFTSLSPVETPLQSVSALEYWDVSRTGSTDLVGVSVAWNNATQSGLVDCASISLASWNGSLWNFIPSNASGMCSGTGAGSLTSAGTIAYFGPLTIGFTEGVYQQQVAVCSGETFEVGAHVYDTSGVYFDLFQDVNGDDSLVVTALTVYPPLDITVQDNVISLVANQSGAVYQWLNCSAGFSAIPGETNPLFAPSANGSYAVVVEVNGCSDTSNCIVVDQLSLNEPTVEFRVFPNPVALGSALTIHSTESIQQIALYSADGKQVKEWPVNHQQEVVVPTEAISSGMYMVNVLFSNGLRQQVRLIVD